MWKDFSKGYLKNNKASGISIIAAAFVSTLLLSLLCGLFYNIWQDEISNIIADEGDWQGRIVGTLEDEDLALIRCFANVKRAEINEAYSGGQEIAVDLTFQNARTIYRDMPLIVKELGLPEDAAEYHELLLSRWLIHDPADSDPPLLLTFYLLVLLAVSVSLILIIHNSFAVSMQARIHQFGILSSIGATPGQIRVCLMQEAAALSAAPVLLGSLAGYALCYGVIGGANLLVQKLPGGHTAIFRYHPAVFAAAIAVSALTVFFSAWIPAGKIGKMTPLEAIRSAGELQLTRKKRRGFLALVFGMEGEIAGASLKAQKRALRTSLLSMTLSFLGFTLMLCFFTLSEISTDYTYFQRYQNAWDVMATVKNTRIEEFRLTKELHGIQGAKDCVVYQKAEGTCLIPAADISDELRALGGMEALCGLNVDAGDVYRIQAPIVILDDESFLAYCKQIGAGERLGGSVVYNRIWDSLNSNFRYPIYVPYIRENGDPILFESKEQEGKTAAIPVAAYAQEAPVLREEYEDYALVQFVPLSLWQAVSGQIGTAEPDLYIRLLAEDNASLAGLNALEETLSGLFADGCEVEIENRIQKKLTNDEMIWGYKVILGGFCGLLAVIGIASVFSNTLGFLRQRKREFARYLSVGMTPAQLKKLFCIEALVIAGRPVAITLPLTALAVSMMIRASYLNPMEFWRRAPIAPVAVFALAIFGFVALAYYLGGRRVLRYSLSEALRDDTMV